MSDWTKYKNAGLGAWNFYKDTSWKTGHESYSGDSSKLRSLKGQGVFSAPHWNESGSSFNANKWNDNAGNFSVAPVQKLYYDDGYRITSYLDATFGTIPPPVGENFHGEHNPCGYWWHFPVYNNCSILTTHLYPVYVEDAVGSTIDLVSGSLGDFVVSYDDSFESITETIDIISGDLSDILVSYDIGYEAITETIDIVSGYLDNKYNAYDYGIENVNTINIDLISGDLRDIVVSYSIPTPDEVKTTNIDLIGGSLGT
jgi:hypothetical protein